MYVVYFNLVAEKTCKRRKSRKTESKTEKACEKTKRKNYTMQKKIIIVF